MATDFDAVVIGSGFGGAGSALRLAEGGYRVLVLERGRRWVPEQYASITPKDWLWNEPRPDQRMVRHPLVRKYWHDRCCRCGRRLAALCECSHRRSRGFLQGRLAA